tara:strand:+ start:1107 stop:1988 length:882 start_codon:yes stop_codon:yes gene_type:complete
MIKYTVIDDSAIQLGGTSLTLEAITEPFKDECEFITTSELTKTHLQFKHPKVWIIGNTMALNKESYEAIVEIIQQRTTIKLDFDYGFCRFRSPTAHRILGKTECDCLVNPETATLKNLYCYIRDNSSIVFYMSEMQRQIHQQAISIKSEQSIVLSSCFTQDSFKKMKEYRSRPKSEKYAIIDGHQGWHSEAKGVKKSINYAVTKNLDYDLFKTDTHDEMLDKLSGYKGLIFLPIIEDTCPRVTIEAKLMGLEVITNENSQHTTESWWNYSLDEIENYLRERPNLLHQELINLS